MTSSVAAVTDTSPDILLEELEADIRRNYETVNKCAFETGRLYVHGKGLCEELGRGSNSGWMRTSFSRGGQSISVYECIQVLGENPKYIDLVPQIQDSSQMLLARPKLKYATEILDYIVENIATEKRPEEKTPHQ